MIDEKHDRSMSGYQCSGSGHICVLCCANQTSCKCNLGSFSIEQKAAETCNLASD